MYVVPKKSFFGLFLGPEPPVENHRFRQNSIVFSAKELLEDGLVSWPGQTGAVPQGGGLGDAQRGLTVADGRDVPALVSHQQRHAVVRAFLQHSAPGAARQGADLLVGG